MNVREKRRICPLPVRLALYYLLLVGMMVAMQRSFIYFPDKMRPDPAKYAMPEVEVIHVRTADGLTLESWYKAPDEDRPVIVLFHGNAMNHAVRTYNMRVFAVGGYGVLLASYRGYAGNPGDPSEEGFYRDARAHLDWLASDKGIPPARTVLYGESLGSGVAVQMATEYAAAALILETPYDSMARLAETHYPFIPFARYLVRDVYASDEKIGSVTMPKLFLIAGLDRIVPAEHSGRLVEAAAEPKTVVTFPQASHNDLYSHGAIQEVLKFLSTLRQ